MDFEVKGESALAENEEVQSKNGLLYVMPNSLSSSVNKTFIRQQAQRSSYTPGQTIVFDMNSGSRFLDPENCSLMMTIATDATVLTADTNYDRFAGIAGALALINEIRVHAKSGVELERIQECNTYAINRMLIRDNHDYVNRYSSLWGGGITGDAAPADVPILGQLSTTEVTVMIPMKLISGLFQPTVKGMKMPPGLMSGARIEIVLESFLRAFGPSVGTGAGTTYTITNPIITCLAHELSDNSQRVLNEESVENGLEYTYTRVFTAVEPSASNTLNIQVKKAVSQGRKAFAIAPLTASVNTQVNDSFDSGLVYSRYQYRIGSSFYPQQRIDTRTEGFYTTLNMYDKPSTSAWYNQAITYDEYAGAKNILGAGFETDSRLNLSGVPINNSQTLELQATVAAGAASYTWYVFLEYVAVARSFLTNVEVKI